MKRGWDRNEPEPLQEPPSYGRRTEGLARRAWERGDASIGFLAEVLDKDRKEMSRLVADWEEDAHIDAVH
jgi:hypothetical protein